MSPEMRLDLLIFEALHCRDVRWPARCAAFLLFVFWALVSESLLLYKIHERRQDCEPLSAAYKLQDVRIDEIAVPKSKFKEHFRLKEFVFDGLALNKVLARRNAHQSLAGQIPVFFLSPKLAEPFLARAIFDRSVQAKSRPSYRFFAFDLGDDDVQWLGDAVWAQHEFVVAALDAIRRHFPDEPSVVIADDFGVYLALSALPDADAQPGLLILDAPGDNNEMIVDSELDEFYRNMTTHWRRRATDEWHQMGVVSFGRGVRDYHRIPSPRHNTTWRVSIDTIDGMGDGSTDRLTQLDCSGYLEHVAELVVEYGEKKAANRTGSEVVREFYTRRDEAKQVGLPPEWDAVHIAEAHEVRTGETRDLTITTQLEWRDETAMIEMEVEASRTCPNECPLWTSESKRACVARTKKKSSQIGKEIQTEIRPIVFRKAVIKKRHGWVEVKMRRGEWAYIWIRSDCVESATIIRGARHIRRKLNGARGEAIEFGIFDSIPSESIRILVATNSTVDRPHCKVSIETSATWHVYGSRYRDIEWQQFFVGLLISTVWLSVFEGETRRARYRSQFEVCLCLLLLSLYHSASFLGSSSSGFIVGVAGGTLLQLLANGFFALLFDIYGLNVTALLQFFDEHVPHTMAGAAVLSTFIPNKALFIDLACSILGYRVLSVSSLLIAAAPLIQLTKVNLGANLGQFKRPAFWMTWLLWAVEWLLGVIEGCDEAPDTRDDAKKRSTRPPPVRNALFKRWHSKINALLATLYFLIFWRHPIERHCIVALTIFVLDRHAANAVPSELLNNPTVNRTVLEMQYEAQEAVETRRMAQRRQVFEKNRRREEAGDNS